MFICKTREILERYVWLSFYVAVFKFYFYRIYGEGKKLFSNIRTMRTTDSWAQISLRFAAITQARD